MAGIGYYLEKSSDLDALADAARLISGSTDKMTFEEIGVSSKTIPATYPITTLRTDTPGAIITATYGRNTVSGEMVVINDIPYPNYPIDVKISGVSNPSEVKLRRFGKNLFGGMLKKLEYTVKSGTLKNTQYGYEICLPAGDYTISANVLDPNASYFIYTVVNNAGGYVNNAYLDKNGSELYFLADKANHGPGHYHINDGDTIFVYSAVNHSYVGLARDVFDTLEIQIEPGTTATEYAPYTETIYSVNTDGTFDEVVSKKNLFKTTDYTKTSMVGSTGELAAQTFAITTDYISLNAGQYIISYMRDGAYLRSVSVYDNDKNFIKNLWSNRVNNYVFTVDTDCLARIDVEKAGPNGENGSSSYPIENHDTFLSDYKFQLEVGATATEYEPYIIATSNMITTISNWENVGNAGQTFSYLVGTYHMMGEEKEFESGDFYGVEKIRDNAFYYGEEDPCDFIAGLHFGDGLKEIGNNAFRWCYKLKDVYLPDTVEIIGENAFESCNMSAIPAMPKNLRSIGSYAFGNCGATSCVDRQLIFSEDVESIGDYVFDENSLTNVSIYIHGKPTIARNAFSGISNATIYVTWTTIETDMPGESSCWGASASRIEYGWKPQ